jgi:hypothetical protein
MAIALDTSGSVDGVPNPTQTLSYTCSGSDRILFAGILGQKTGGDRLTSVTYNGVAMTRIGYVAQNAAVNIYLYMLVNPASGTHNLVTTFNATMDYGYIRAVSYTGAAQTGQPDSFNTGGPTTTTSFTLSTTVVASGCWLVGYFRNESGNFTAGSGTTLRNPAADNDLADSNGTVGTGSQSLVMNPPGSTLVSGIIASISPAITTSIKTVNGLAKASVKTFNGLAIASVKSINGLA